MQVASNVLRHGPIMSIQTAPDLFEQASYVTTSFPVTYPVALSFFIFGTGLLQARAVMACFILCFLLAAYLLLKRESARPLPLLGLTLLATFAPLYGNGKNVLGEIPGLLFLFLSLYFVRRIESGRRNIFEYIGLGVFFGLMVSTKPIFILAIVPAAIVFFFSLRLFDLKRASVTILGFAAVAASWFVIQFGTGDWKKEFLSHYVNPYQTDTLTNVLHNAIGFVTHIETLYALALLAAINLGAWGGFWLTHSGNRNLERARHAQPWSELLRSTAPTLLVLGDYYIFGERDEAAGIDRLVREYDVNSREDLDAWLMKNPKAMGRYRDLDLYYLPIGSAFALRSIAPILAEAGGGMGTDRLRVAMASDLTSDMLKHNNIVYLGYLSGLGVLRGPVFAGSRFAIGDTYDELVDSASGRSYVSQEGGPSAGEASHRDFGYVTAFKGPQGHRIVVIAGTRDVALMQAAEALAAPASLAALKRADKGAENFEALYEVQGIRRNNLNGRLIQAAPRSARNPWTPDANLHFPEG